MKKGLNSYWDGFSVQQDDFARNFDEKSPKIYEIAQNFARNFDTLLQPGGPVPPPPPTPMVYGDWRYR